jgi:mono/diheme cytochrome c family protein
MRLSRILAAAALAAAAVAAGSAYQVKRPWPPGVQQVPDESPVLSPADASKTFFMPPGYRLELVVSEPMIQDPVWIDFDADGRMWAIEMPGYMPDIAPSSEREREPTGRVVVLEDVNDDGQMDKRTVFLDGLVLPRTLKVLDRGVLVAEPPNLWLVRDTDGDLRADAKELVTDTYGRREANVEHNANSLLWALDNWMYTSEVDVYLRLKNGKFEVRRTLSRGQWGASQDDAGRIYRNSNPSVLHVDVVPTPYYARNPALLRTRGSYESLRGDKNEVNVVWPVRPTPGVNRGYQPGVLRADATLTAYTAASAPTVYRGDRLPRDLYGNVFVADPAANLISRVIVSDDGTALRSRKAYDRAEFLASTDERFRPVYMLGAPDGTMYVVDMYRGIIQHRAYITEYLRDQILSRKLEQPTGYGRIYRVVHDTTKRDRKPALSSASEQRLVATLSHPNGWWRDTAHRLLVERDAKSVAGALRKLASSTAAARTRLHALWTLDGLDSLDAGTVVRALEDRSRDVRASALRLAERWLGEPNHPVQPAVLKRLDDADWAVRRQLAATLGELPADRKEQAIVTLLERRADDPITLDAALSGLRGREAAVLNTLLQSNAQTPQRDAAITMLAATIVRAADDPAIQNVFERVAEEARPGWQRSVLLRGAEVALLGAAMPGAIGRGGAAPPEDPDAIGQVAPPPAGRGAGGRGGPGGAAAFPRAAAGGARGRGAGAGVGGRGRGRGRGGAGVALKLTREPALAKLAAADSGDLAQRAASLLARIEWPGKPGVAAAAPPLTPDEQRRFGQGSEIYRNLCAACHQPDGRGREKIAPSILGSELAVGPAGIPIRIVLNGKEGSTGLMPPLGATLSDEQIAAALTYIRREWGHTASPIDPATVGEVRAATTGRTQPWTAEELVKIGGNNP